MTAYQRHHHVPYEGKILPFGVMLEAKIFDPERRRSKFDSTFLPGLYSGRAVDSDARYIGTDRGVFITDGAATQCV